MCDDVGTVRLVTGPIVVGGSSGYLVGEIPEYLLLDMDTATGGPVDLTGFTAKLTYKVGSTGVQVERDATLVDAGEGRVGMVWIAADFATPGWMQGEVTVGNGGTQRYAESFKCKVRNPLGGPLPAI